MTDYSKGSTLSTLTRDARRYRWLEANGLKGLQIALDRCPQGTIGDAIDKARALPPFKFTIECTIKGDFYAISIFTPGGKDPLYTEHHSRQQAYTALNALQMTLVNCQTTLCITLDDLERYRAATP